MNYPARRQIHIRYFLTDNILVTYDGVPSLNACREYWALVATATVASDVECELDKNPGPASFAGHICWESRPFMLGEYLVPEFAGRLHKQMEDEIRAAIAANQLTPITQVPRKLKQSAP